MYDVTFIGHMCIDEIVPYEGEKIIAPGSAVLCGAMAAARTGKKVAVVAKMSKSDEGLLDRFRSAGIDAFLIPAPETTYMRVIHPSPDVDVRQMFQPRCAGFIELSEVPEIQTRYLHLAGISDREFTIDLIRGLKAKGYCVSADMQNFVRQVDPETKEIFFRDVTNKKEIVSLLDKVKLDVVEAKLTTGTDDLEQAARTYAAWGSRETVITRSDGVFAHAQDTTYYEKFSNRSVVGRTGRGDTTFAAYLSRRLDHSVGESLKFAAALVSLKMETPGPFSGTLEQVLQRMKDSHPG